MTIEINNTSCQLGLDTLINYRQLFRNAKSFSEQFRLTIQLMLSFSGL